MSKSLKNFVTIRDALSTYSARSIRLAFLLHRYNAPMDYSLECMQEAADIEKALAEYFHNLKAVLRSLPGATAGAAGGEGGHCGKKEHEMLAKLGAARNKVRLALQDDFDTPKAIQVLRELIKDCNKYMNTAHNHNNPPVVATGQGPPSGPESGTAYPISGTVLKSVGRYVTSMLKVFGLVNTGTEIGFPAAVKAGEGQAAAGAGAAAAAAAGREEVLRPVLDLLTAFRQQVRLAAAGGDAVATKEEVMRLADELRDDLLPELGTPRTFPRPLSPYSLLLTAPCSLLTAPCSWFMALTALGVRLEDRGFTQSLWKLEDDPSQLLKERQQRQHAQQAKAQQRAEAAQRAAEKEARARIAPQQMFLHLTEQYSAFDAATGLPTHDSQGVALAASALKKLGKEQARQQEMHDKYLLKQAKGEGEGNRA
jgi:cysteinyl-tRNA synthetase